MLLVNWPHVWMVTGVGFLMVIALLIVLIFILKGLGAIVSSTVSKAAKPAKAAPAAAAAKAEVKSDSDEIPEAAIAMALHLYFNGVHDEEPTQITIKNVERRYSPWNSKLYGMNNLHR